MFSLHREDSRCYIICSIFLPPALIHGSYFVGRSDLSKLVTQALLVFTHLKADWILEILGTLFYKVSPKMTWLPKNNPFKLIFCDLILCKYCPSWEPRNCLTISVTKIHRSVQELMTKFKHIKSGRSGWSNQLCLERKFTLNKNLIWSQLTRPPRKKTEKLWSGHSLGWNSCWANRKGILESRAPGFMECTRTHSTSFHALSAYFIPINTLYKYKYSGLAYLDLGSFHG